MTRRALHAPRRARGFSTLEFVLVAAITGILILGLGAVVEVPREMAAQELSGDSRLSEVDRALKWLDDDVRFAKEVTNPTPTELRITRKDGRLVTYSWGGPGGPLVRVAPEGTANLIEAVEHAKFSLGVSEMSVDFTAGEVVESRLQTAGFEAFGLRAGYGFADMLPAESLLTPVDVVTQTRTVESANKVGIVFRATDLEDDDAYLESVRVRLRRAGPGGIFVDVCEAFGAPLRPNWMKPIAGTYVSNAALPASMSDFEIRLPGTKKLRQGKTYFVEIAAEPDRTAVEVEVRTLTDADAATASGSGVVSSTNGGISYAPLASRLDASQTVFSVTAKKMVTETVASAGEVVMVPTCVQATLQLQTSEGPSSLDTSFPIENNLALVNQ